MSKEFDIIFAGGGTAACVIAGRLAAANPSFKILIVESGQHSRDVPKHVQPCRYHEHLAPGSTTVYSQVGKQSKHLNGRAPVVQCGKAVGGGSTVNFMLYTRGAESDYNDWESLGNKGWGFNDVLPLIKKLETFTPISGRPTHGYSGPIQISSSRTDFGFGSQFLKVAKEYDPDRPLVDDAHDFKTPNAYGPSYRYIDPVTGKRCDAASRYLYPQSGNPNLEIVVGKRVKRVVIENGRAVGIDYYGNDGMGGNTELVTVKARKLVIVAAGAFGSPAILERSGVGAQSVLQKNDIPILVDLPGVGEHYQDHIGACPVFHASDEIDTLDDVWSDPKVFDAQLKEWEETGSGKISHNGMEALLKMRPTTAELASAGPALKSRWETYFERSPDKPMGMIVPFAGSHPLFRPAPGQKFMSAMYSLLYPDSLGSVHITSGEDADSPLDFDPNFLSKDGDIEMFALVYKLIRELIRRMPAYRGEVPLSHPKFSSSSAAACKEKNDPVPIDAPDIVYTDADNEAIANFHRDAVTTTWHSLGTCAMKPRDKGGVVDARLNVYGVEGLKVADMSICPSNVGNNTYSTALLVGEKAATIIAEDLGVRLHDGAVLDGSSKISAYKSSLRRSVSASGKYI